MDSYIVEEKDQTIDKKRLCLLIQSLDTGGMQRVMSELAGYFCEKENIEVHLVMYGKRPELFYKVPDNLIIHKPVTAFNNKLRFLHTIKRLIYLRNTVRRINPDTLLSFGELWNSFALLALLGLHYPIYISDRCKPDRMYNTVHSILRKWLYPKATGIVTQTMIAKKIYASIFNHRNIAVIGNPIRKILPDDHRERENIVLTVGRLIPTKHHDLLIDIFLRINNPSWKLVIIGDNAPPYDIMSLLKKKIKENSAEDRVILAGNIAEVDDYYLKSKIFAFTSSSEGFPNVIGEAMSAVLPVIAFDCIAGPSELIDNGKTGFLIPLFDNKEFENKLSLLMNDENTRDQMSKAALSRINHYSIENIGSQYFRFILNSNPD